MQGLETFMFGRPTAPDMHSRETLIFGLPGSRPVLRPTVMKCGLPAMFLAPRGSPGVPVRWGVLPVIVWGSPGAPPGTPRGAVLENAIHARDRTEKR